MNKKNEDDLPTESFEDLSDEALDEIVETSDADEFDTGDLGDENWDNENEQASSRKKKKGGLFNTIIIGGGILAAVVFVYLKFMSGPSSVAPLPVNTPPVATAPVPVDGAAAQPPTTPPDTIAADVPVQPEAPQPLTPMPDEVPVGMVSQDSGLVTQIPVPAAGGDVTAESVPAPMAPVPQPVPEVLPPAMQQMAKAPQPDQQMASMETPSQPKISSPVVDDARLQAIETRLGEIAAALATQQDTAGTLQSLSDAVADLSRRVSKIEAIPAAVAKAEKRVVPSDTPEKPVSKSAPMTKATPKKQIAQVWVLRAVSDGAAYVAPKGSNDLKTVRVGDAVPGLGQIQAISQVAGKWQIVTSGGTLSQ